MSVKTGKELSKVELVCLRCGTTFLTENQEDTVVLGKYIIKRCYKNKQDSDVDRISTCPNCNSKNRKDFRIFVDEDTKLQKFGELLDLYGNSDMYRKFVDDKRPFTESDDHRVLVRLPMLAMTILGFEMDNAVVTTHIRSEKTHEVVEYLKKHTKKRLTIAGVGKSCSVDSISFGYDDLAKYNLGSFYLGIDEGEHKNIDIGEVVLDRNKVMNLPKSQSSKLTCSGCSEGTGIKVTKTPYCPGCGLNNTLVKKRNCLICQGTSVPKHPFKADNFNITTEPCSSCMGRGYMNSKKDFFLGPLGIPIPKGIADVIATSTFAYTVKLLFGSGRLTIKTDMFDIIVFRSRVVFPQSDLDKFLGPIGVQIIEFDRPMTKE